MKYFIAALITICLISTAEARHRKTLCLICGEARVHVTLHRDYRPRAWCGWYMAHKIYGRNVPRLNLARNWMHEGRPSHPHVGAIVVWRHHVGQIVGYNGRQWVVESGNDGHRVRSRPRSIAGAVIREI